MQKRKLLVVCLLVLGCGAAKTSTPASPTPLSPQQQSELVVTLQAKTSDIASVAFTTSTDIPQNPAPPVSASGGAKNAQSLYSATLSLQIVPKGIYSCPADWGVLYHLSFQGQTAVQIDLSPNGCSWASVVGEDLSFQLTNDYWQTVADTLGIDEAKIFPYDPPGLPQ